MDTTSSPSSMTDCYEYNELIRRVDEGTLRITFVNGLPRGGTTAFERFVFEGLDHTFDINSNQPGLLVRVPEGESRDRQKTMWGNVLEPVLEKEHQAKVEGRDLQTYPINVVVKETSNVVMPSEEELMRWQRLAHTIILIIRNPVLQIESRILCIGDRIISGAMKDDLGISKELDPRSFKIHGKPLIKPNTDFSHIKFSDTSKGTPWEQHYTYMKLQRDYSSLDEGYINFCGLHPLFEEPDIQRCMWKTYIETHSKSEAPSNASQQIEQYVGTKLEDFQKLPDWMQSAMFLWRFGWIEFTKQLDLLKGCNNVHIIDMSEAQAASNYYKEQLEKLIFDGRKQYVKQSSVEEEKKEEKEGTFDVGNGKCDKWDAWFHGPCFTQHAKQCHRLKPPSKKPCSISKGAFPSFLEKQMSDIMQQYRDARLDDRRICAPEVELSKYDGVDLIFDTLRKNEEKENDSNSISNDMLLSLV